MESTIHRIGAVFTAVGLVLVLAMVDWAPARQDVADPPPDASAQQVVSSYLAAVNARDFSTANRLTLSSVLQFGRLDRAPSFSQIQVGQPRQDDDGSATLGTGFRESVFVPVEFVRNAETATPTPWGYRLVRTSADAPWRIIDNGPV